jgi:hypothetical protein
VELQTRSIKTVKIKTTVHRKSVMGRERENEGFILEIESDGRLVGTTSNSACFTVSYVHYMGAGGYPKFIKAKIRELNVQRTRSCVHI